MTIGGWTEKSEAELEALIEVMFFVARADGGFSIPERRQFFETVQSLSEGAIESGELAARLARCEALLAEVGMAARLQVLGTVLTDDLSRRLAYGLGVKVAMADGEVKHSEQIVLDEIAEAFLLAEDDPEEIAESVRRSARPEEI